MFNRSATNADSIPTQPNAEQVLSDRTLSILGIMVLLSQLPLMLNLPVWLTLPGVALVAYKLVQVPERRSLLPPALTIIFLFVAVAGVFAHYDHLFGRDPCVAFLFLLLSFKFVETNRNYDASLLVILCAFLLLTQFFFTQSLTAAILSIPSMYFIGLSLFALQRGTAKTSTRTMVHITAKLFLQAMPIATILFVAVPRISQTPWSGNGNGQAQTGLSSSMSPGSIASLSKSDQVAFRVEFESQAPHVRERYWRGPVLSGYDGYNWFILPGKPATSSQPDPNGRSINYTITTNASFQPWLLALDTPTAAPEIENDKKLMVSLNHELQIDTATVIDQTLRYRATSVLSDRFIPSVPPGYESLLTSGNNPRARSFAQQLRQKYPNDLLLANKILTWFNREPFHYTLNPPKLGSHTVDDFIFNTRRGFCEHYAGSFVFLMRAAGIPARVVTGYQGGEMSNGYMIVRQSDAHAWAEAYIDGRWRRFDPTAAVSPQRVEQGATQALRDDPSQSLMKKINIPLINTVALKWDAVNFAWQRMVINFDSNHQLAIWKKFGVEKPSALIIVLALITAAVLWALLILKPLRGLARKQLSPCEKYWRKLSKKLQAQGFNRAPGETYNAFIERACLNWPNYRQPLQLFISAYHDGVFAPQASDLRHNRKMAQQMKDALNQIGQLS